VNEDGFLETPAVRVAKEVPAKAEELVGRIADEDIVDKKGNVIVKDNEYIDEKAAKKIEKEYGKLGKMIRVRPFLMKDKQTGEYVIDWISPEMDEKVIIADITTPIDEYGNILEKRVAGRHYMEMEVFHVNDITHVDVNPSQIFSANTSLIPFVDHDDAVRAAMGTNMQRQAVPLIKPEAPLV
jgi:DNA-directed RNA polymerase subunit beta